MPAAAAEESSAVERDPETTPMPSNAVPATWKEILTVGLSAVLAFAAFDVALRAVAPPVRLVEVEDAVAAYRTSDPTVLVLGSSHARTFAVLGAELEARTDGRERVLAVPVEWGKLSSYAWVLHNRLAPLVEEHHEHGGGLRRLVLVTEWWDSVAPEGDGRAPNLPARAWTVGHFTRDVWANGIDTYNGNYVSARWRRLWSGSSLVQDHGHGRILEGLKDRLRPPPANAEERPRERDLVNWRKMVEQGYAHLLDEGEMAAFDDILDLAREWGLEVTVLLYPRMPGTLTEKARSTTLPAFSKAIAERIEGTGVRFVDFTTASPLTDKEFTPDLDHVTSRGNALFSAWALDGELAFLLRRP